MTFSPIIKEICSQYCFFFKELKTLFIILFIFPVWLPYFILLEVNPERRSYCLVVCHVTRRYNDNFKADSY